MSRLRILYTGSLETSGSHGRKFATLSRERFLSLSLLLFGARGWNDFLKESAKLMDYLSSCTITIVWKITVTRNFVSLVVFTRSQYRDETNLLRFVSQRNNSLSREFSHVRFVLSISYTIVKVSRFSQVSCTYVLLYRLDSARWRELQFILFFLCISVRTDLHCLNSLIPFFR